MPEQVLTDLLMVLTTGLVANVACQRLGVSTILGYLIAGLVLGDAGLSLVHDGNSALMLVAARLRHVAGTK